MMNEKNNNQNNQNNQNQNKNKNCPSNEIKKQDNNNKK